MKSFRWKNVKKESMEKGGAVLVDSLFDKSDLKLVWVKRKAEWSSFPYWTFLPGEPLRQNFSENAM